MPKTFDRVISKTFGCGQYKTILFLIAIEYLLFSYYYCYCQLAKVWKYAFLVIKSNKLLKHLFPSKSKDIKVLTIQVWSPEIQPGSSSSTQWTSEDHSSVGRLLRSDGPSACFWMIQQNLPVWHHRVGLPESETIRWKGAVKVSLGLVNSTVEK